MSLKFSKRKAQHPAAGGPEAFPSEPALYVFVHDRIAVRADGVADIRSGVVFKRLRHECIPLALDELLLSPLIRHEGLIS